MQKVLIIESDTKNLGKLEIFLKNVFLYYNLDFLHFNRVFIGLSEAVINSIVHGNQFISSKKVYVFSNCLNSQLSFFIKDEGIGFDHNCLDNPTNLENIKKESGRGIFILKNLADSVVYSKSGSCVRIKFILKK